MAEEFLQVAFEIKATCDEISRRLLRWHWEQHPGKHDLNALLKHVAQRQTEDADYYERLPDLSGKNSWSQLDTTVCMRILLDPEQNASQPLDLLGNTPHPGAARHACNAVRTARNEAAHATDLTGAARSAILFNEAVESLEEGYMGMALRADEIEQYYKMADTFVEECKGKGQAPAKEKAPASPKAPKKSQSRSSDSSDSSDKADVDIIARPKRSRRAAKPDSPVPESSNKPTGKATGTRGSRSKRSPTEEKRTSGEKKPQGKKNTKRAKQHKENNRRAVFLGMLVVFLLGLLIRAMQMGYGPF